jgi:hypothetical protein
VAYGLQRWIPLEIGSSASKMRPLAGDAEVTDRTIWILLAVIVVLMAAFMFTQAW